MQTSHSLHSLTQFNVAVTSSSHCQPFRSDASHLICVGVCSTGTCRFFFWERETRTKGGAAEPRGSVGSRTDALNNKRFIFRRYQSALQTQWPEGSGTSPRPSEPGDTSWTSPAAPAEDRDRTAGVELHLPIVGVDFEHSLPNENRKQEENRFFRFHSFLPCIWLVLSASLLDFVGSFLFSF